MSGTACRPRLFCARLAQRCRSCLATRRALLLLWPPYVRTPQPQSPQPPSLPPRRPALQAVSPLHMAAAANATALVDELLQQGGADAAAPDAKGNTPLHVAAAGCVKVGRRGSPDCRPHTCRQAAVVMFDICVRARPFIVLMREWGGVKPWQGGGGEESGVLHCWPRPWPDAAGPQLTRTILTTHPPIPPCHCAMCSVLLPAAGATRVHCGRCWRRRRAAPAWPTRRGAQRRSWQRRQAMQTP